MSHRLILILAAITSAAYSSQPKTVAELPDPNPEIQKAAFVVPEGFEISLFASEPMLRKPVQMNWDSRGRLWVVSSTTYPHIKPGEGANDEIVVLEDANGDGVADKSTVFTNDLHIPTAVIPGDGGAYVANSTEVLFLRDADGDLKADADGRTILLSGFGTEDTHHLLHTMRFGPEGLLHFLQSIYIHSHVETPFGVRRLLGGGVWEFRPETRRLEVISKGLINPWGFEYDRWGQSFASDGAGSEGVNFIFPGSVFATSPGAARILHGMSPGQPKHAGLEIIDEPYFGDDWQGSVVACDFRGNRVNRFKLTPSGSSYTAAQQPDVLASTHRAFRPIDVKVGPDGALYIADWYNPIIQHGEVDFRDERRDHVHGRIWRITRKGAPLAEKPVFAGKTAAELLEMLKSPRKYTRHFAKRELRALGADKVVPVVDAAAAANPDDHFLLELAWSRECVNAFSPKLWRQLWSVADARVKAAALRILSHRWKELPDALKICEAAVAHPNAQVRLWAVAVLADMKSPAAFGVALRVLEAPMDESLDFLLEQIAREQADVWMPALKIEKAKHLVYAMKATGRSDALPPLFAALKTGKLSADDSAQVMAVAAGAADAKQARQMADMANDPKLASQRVALMDALVGAATTRSIKPEGAEALAQEWLADARPEVVHRAAILAGAWKVEPARATLAALITKADTLAPIRDGAVQGLTKLGGTASRDFFDKLFRDQPQLRVLAIQGLADTGPNIAAKRAVEFLSQAKSAAEVAPVLGVFLRNKQLPGTLAKELGSATLPEVVAVEAIRMTASRGVQGPLIDVLRKAGAVKQMDRPLTPEEMTRLVAKVKTDGNAARGEQVYRRQALLCQTCHAIGEAGGVLGPNLVSIGASAPVDYLIESLLEPSKKIKEGYHMVIITMKDGTVTSGGLVQDAKDEIVIRDPANQLHKVPTAKIASRVMSPASMMIPGLTASLREDEFADLVRFLSELGREGDYKIKPNRYVRTWKAMGKMEQTDIDHVRHVGLHALAEKNHPYPWTLAFSKVSGAVPLDELPAAARMYPWFPKIVQFTIKTDAPGKMKLGLSVTKGIILVIGEKTIQEPGAEPVLDLAAGANVISVLVTRDAGEVSDLRVELLEGAGTVE